MKELFANLYEWWGLLPFYSTDMGDHLRGFDITCSDYTGTPWYFFIGFIMVIITAIFYVIQYHLLDSARFNKKLHWWIVAVIVLIINFFVAFSITFNSLQAGDYCNQLNISVTDCIGFGFSNALWGLVLFVLITSFRYPRSIANNCRNTTFWKP